MTYGVIFVKSGFAATIHLIGPSVKAVKFVSIWGRMCCCVHMCMCVGQTNRDREMVYILKHIATANRRKKLLRFFNVCFVVRAHCHFNGDMFENHIYFPLMILGNRDSQ